MTDTMPSTFTGPIFEILAGSEKTRFFAHASVLEKSDKLKAVSRGEWKDSSERIILLEDWEPETVGRLLEWLYTGDYETPFPAEASPLAAETLESLASEKPMPSNDVKDVLISSMPEKIGSAKGSQQAPKSFEDIEYKKADPKLAPSNAEAFALWTATFKKANPCGLNFEGILLAHAKLYSLADYTLLPVLQAQAFQRIKAVLSFMHYFYLRVVGPDLPTGNQPVIINIITLVRYVYANTVRLVSEEEPLRELISTFIALNYDKFKDEEGVVREFMGQGEDLQADMHDKVQVMVLAMKNELEKMKAELEESKNIIRFLKDRR